MLSRAGLVCPPIYHHMIKVVNQNFMEGQFEKALSISDLSGSLGHVASPSEVVARIVSILKRGES